MTVNTRLWKAENLHLHYCHKRGIHVMFIHGHIISLSMNLLYVEVYLLLQFGRSNMAKISENWGRLEGVLFQHFVIMYFRVCWQSFGISGLSPHAAMPTAAWTGENEEYAASPVTISQITIPKLYTLLIHVSVTFSGSPAIICSQPNKR